MAARYLLHHRGKTRPSLLVEVVDAISDEVVARVKRAMCDLVCPHALVMDEDRTLILRDTFAGLEEDSIIQEATLNSRDILVGTGAGTLTERVGRWLDGLVSNWREALPDEEWVGLLLYDVVPAALDSTVERIDSDAA